MTGRPRNPIGTTGEIWVKKTGDRATAYAKHRDLDGITRQYERSAATPTAARNKLKKFLADPNRPQGRGRINSNTRMATLADEYFTRLDKDAEAGHVSANTVRLYRGHWDNHGQPALGALSVSEADVQILDHFLLKLREHSPAIAKTMRAVLSGMMGMAARYKAIPTNPVRDVSRLRSAPTKPVRALEPGEAVDLLLKLTALSRMPGDTIWVRNRTYTPTRIHPYIPDLALWMLGTSLRIGQALGVFWPDIDFDQARAKVGPNVIRVKGEGLTINRGTSKTKEQVLGLPSWVMTMLLLRREAAVNPLGAVFADEQGFLRDPHNTLGDLRRALNMVPGYEWVTSHTFRKTVATELDRAGVSARLIADQLGHARVSMTQDVYMARNARNSEAAAAIEAMLTAEPQRRVIPLDQGTRMT